MKNEVGRKLAGGWRGSAAQIAMSTEAIRHWNRHGRYLHPKCGAKRKSDGQPCQALAMKNGRCRVHGGRVPSGDAWHRPRWPDGSAPGALRKLNRKLADLERAASKRARRAAGMTPEERSAYDAWLRDHAPTSTSDRAQKREFRRQDREARNSIERLANEPPRPQSAEALELQEKIDALKAELAAGHEFTKGVFS